MMTPIFRTAALAVILMTMIPGCTLFWDAIVCTLPTIPAGAISTTRDMGGNQWTLAQGPSGQRLLLVLPAMSTKGWGDPQIPGLTAGGWREIRVESDGYIWLIGDRTVRFDPRRLEAGIVDAALPATRPGSHWRVVGRMPVGNHDISAAVLDGRVYYAGGLTADFGLPPRSKSFNAVWEFNPATKCWWVAGRLANDRIYAATATFDGNLWVIGGDVARTGSQRATTKVVECFSPRVEFAPPWSQPGDDAKRTRDFDVIAAPASPVARPMPVALVANSRLYVVGCAAEDRQLIGKMESLGAGEATWRQEPDGPAGMGALAGAALEDKLYIVVPKKGLAVFDTKAGRWDMIEMPVTPGIPRSCQMAAYRGEIWMMGGVDVSDPLQTTIFNPRTGQFRAGPPLPVALSWGACAVVNDQLLILGGAGLRSSKDAIYVYSDRVYALVDDAEAR